ncbi:hypothetical protein D3C87_1256700 [compost metagenome]
MQEEIDHSRKYGVLCRPNGDRDLLPIAADIRFLDYGGNLQPLIGFLTSETLFLRIIGDGDRRQFGLVGGGNTLSLKAAFETGGKLP